MKRLAIGLLSLVSCGGELVYCTELATMLAECDVAPAELSCELITFADRVAIRDDLDEKGCAAVWNDDGTVDDRMCRAFGWECPAPIADTDDEVPLINAVLLVGGVDENEYFGYSERVLDGLANRTSVPVSLYQPPGWTTREIRSLQLARVIRQVAAESPGGQVNLVCYAVGGLDCRYVVSPGGLYAGDETSRQELVSKVASITTIATPHRGTSVADAALYISDDVLGALLGQRAAGARSDPEIVRAIEELSPENATAFNETVVDAELPYYSWAGVTHLFGSPLLPTDQMILDECLDAEGRPSLLAHPDTRDVMSDLLAPTAPFAGRTIGAAGQTILAPHDGMVSVDSARWGVFQGCVAADHYDVIGQVQDGGIDPITGFEASRFYAQILDDLFRRGF